MQSPKLRPIYSAEASVKPLSKSAKVSLLKVEKVLNPPQNPKVQKILAEGDSKCRVSARPSMIPSAKQASTLAARVPNGK